MCSALLLPVRPSKALEGGVNDSPVVPDYYALYGQHTVDGDDTYDLAFFVGPMHVLLVERAPQHKEKGTLSTCHCDCTGDGYGRLQVGGGKLSLIMLE